MDLHKNNAVPLQPSSSSCMVIEVHDFHTTFWSRREDAQMYKYNWVFLTWCPPFPWGRSHCRPGDLKKFLHENYGSDAVGSTFSPRHSFLRKHHSLTFVLVLVEGELWTDESVFWQNKLQDRGVYEVVYRKSPQVKIVTDVQNRQAVVFPVPTTAKRSRTQCTVGY
jgi:hypothetical protein